MGYRGLHVAVHCVISFLGKERGSLDLMQIPAPIQIALAVTPNQAGRRGPSQDNRCGGRWVFYFRFRLSISRAGAMDHVAVREHKLRNKNLLSRAACSTFSSGFFVLGFLLQADGLRFV